MKQGPEQGGLAQESNQGNILGLGLLHSRPADLLMRVYYYDEQTCEIYSPRTSLYSPPLSSSLLALSPSTTFAVCPSLSLNFSLLSHQQDGRFCTRREPESKPQYPSR